MTRVSHRQTSNIKRTLVGIKIANIELENRLSALLQLHFHSQLHTWLQWLGQKQLQDETVDI